MAGLRCAALLFLCTPFVANAQVCEPRGVQVQILGSGGPELKDNRASSSYLVWIDGAARVLVDMGGGAALRFAESGAKATDLDLILFTHLHVDHTADFPAIVKSAGFENRTRALPVYGPVGNRFSPSTVTFVRTLFDTTRGAYRYLGTTLSPLAQNSFKLEPHDVRERAKKIGARRDDEATVIEAFSSQRLRAAAASVIHGVFPALAWRVETKNKVIVFSGDTNGEGGGLDIAAQNADLLIAHNAVPEGATGVERYLHMPPSVIGRIAELARVKQLVLSHRMLRTLGREEETRTAIKQNYSGPLAFANDLDCVRP